MPLAQAGKAPGSNESKPEDRPENFTKLHGQAAHLFSRQQCVRCAKPVVGRSGRRPGRGLGVGWVSIFHQAELQEALGIPKGITPIAYLCVGYVSHFHTKPELESAGWLPRLPMEDLVYFDQWGNRDDDQSLIGHLKRDQAIAQEAGAAKQVADVTP